MPVSLPFTAGQTRLTALAAPVLAVMLLVSVAIGLVGRVLPETNVLVVAMPARVLVGVCLLGVVVTGVGRAMTDAVPGVLHEVQATLNGVTPR